MRLKYIIVAIFVVTTLAGGKLFADNIFQKTETEKTMKNFFPGTKLFHAKGQHQCWSTRYAGYWCDVDGRNYTDCQQAYYDLRRRDCCNQMYLDNKRLDDGRSIDFRLNSCSSFK